MRLQPNEIPILREYFARGGSAMVDDFHGPAEWADFEQQMKLLFPDRRSSKCRRTTRSSAASTNSTGSRRSPASVRFSPAGPGRRGGVTQHLRMIQDDDGRPMMFINFNTDMGDGWEWSNAQDYPGYIKYTALAYRMGINEIIYALTH